jgi:4-hydroxy 2-oxovalerate aldolase
MKKKIFVLDCTLRDGGFALEDAMINGDKTKVFDRTTILNFIKQIKRSKIEFIEIGAIEISDYNKKKFSIYKNLQEISKLIPKNKSSKQMYAALYRGPDTPSKDIPKWNPSYCKYIRVIIRYSEMKKSLEFCRMLSEKGYDVFVQPMVTSRYSLPELKTLIKECNNFSAYALYIVDSYGLMNSKDVLKLFKIFDDGLNKKIKIGFHGHNNLNLAFSNAISIVEQNSNRSVIIDSSIMGMGQGAGNVQTELLISLLNIKKKYNFNCILNACEIIEEYLKNNLWGYSVKNLIPAINNTAYKFSSFLRKKHNLTYSEINQILTKMPEKYRNRYTEKNASKTIKYLKKKN